MALSLRKHFGDQVLQSKDEDCFSSLKDRRETMTENPSLYIHAREAQVSSHCRKVTLLSAPSLDLARRTSKPSIDCLVHNLPYTTPSAIRNPPPALGTFTHPSI